MHGTCGIAEHFEQNMRVYLELLMQPLERMDYKVAISTDIMLEVSMFEFWKVF